MTADDHRLAGVLFDQLRQLSESQRIAILDVACAANPKLRDEVLLLLDADRDLSSVSFLGRPALHDAAELLIADAPKLPQSGAVMGNYCLGARIGAGGMGVVYEARDLRLQRRVAVKILPLPFISEGPDRVKRFQREAQAASMLNHASILSIFDAGFAENYWFIATEFVEGQTLRQRLSSGPLPLKETFEIATQCASALEVAHKAGVLHRDIKPENIMIRPDGLVKLLDFGLALVSGDRDDLGVAETQAGMAVGTPRYMAPEQARGERVDARADVFSLGAVVYEMACGRPAFPGETNAEVFANLLKHDPELPSELDESLPEDLDPVILMAIAKDRVCRYQTMADFGAALRSLQQKLDTQEQIRAWRASRRPRRRAAAAAAAVALIATCGVGWRAWSARSTVPDEAPLYGVPVTSFAGFKDYPAVSPDGTRLAFAWNGGAGGSGGKPERNIYVKDLASGDPVAITDSASDNLWPSWSPDGKFLAFGRRRQESRSEFFIVPSTGGPERKVADGGTGVSWSPDGAVLALAREAPPAGTGGIFLLDLETGDQRTLTDPKPGSDYWPAFSPDGHWIAFTRGSSGLRREVWVIPADGGTPRQLTDDGKMIFGLTWTPDSSEIVFSSRREGSGENLWRVAVAGGPAKRLAVTDATHPQIPLHRRQLVYNQSSLDTNIYRLDGPGFHDAAPGSFRPATPLILSSREDDSPAFSADGRWIVFASTRSGNAEIWKARVDGGGAMQLTFFNGATVGTPRWSPDGRFIAFDCTSGGKTDIYIVGADGASLRRFTSGRSAIMPSWSPDGRWVYYAAEGGGANQLWRAPVDGGAAVQLTRGGIRESWPSPDGKLVYFTRRRPEAEIWTVDIDGGGEQPLAELKAYNRITRAWGVIPQGIYFISREDGPRQEVRFFSFASRRVSTIATLEKEPIWRVPTLALSPDGQSLLTVHLDHEVNDLMLIDNFQ